MFLSPEQGRVCSVLFANFIEVYFCPTKPGAEMHWLIHNEKSGVDFNEISLSNHTELTSSLDSLHCA